MFDDLNLISFKPISITFNPRYFLKLLTFFIVMIVYELKNAFVYESSNECQLSRNT